MNAFYLLSEGFRRLPSSFILPALVLIGVIGFLGCVILLLPWL